MAINKVVYGDNTLIDLTNTTATADRIVSGTGAYGADGVWIDGTLTEVFPSDDNPVMDGTASPGVSINYSRADHVHPHDTSKADKVQNATSGNFATLDANGNLTDSGHKSSDYAASEAGVPAGGSAGQVLKKQSATDYDTAWGNDIAVTGSTIQATETTKDNLSEVIKAVLDSVNPQNWAAGIYRGKFIRNGGGVKTSFTGDYHMMISTPGANYATQGIVAAQGRIFNIWYGNAVWIVTEQAKADLGITGASVGDLVQIKTVSSGKPTAFTKVPLNEIKCNRNLLDNWYFVGGGSQLGYGTLPINQRGQTSYIGGVYGLDRWKVSNSNGSVSVGSQNITFSSASGTSDFRQIINGVSALLGKKLTLSILLNEGLYAITGTVPSTIPSSETTVAYGYVLGSNQAGIWIRVSSDGIVAQCRAAQGTPLNMIAVKLEIGDTQTLAHQENGAWVLNEIPDYSEQLYRCLDSHADSGDTYANKSPSDYLNNGLPSKFVMLTPQTPALYIPNSCRCYGVMLDSNAARCGLYYLCATTAGSPVVGKFTSSGIDVTGSTNKVTFAVPLGSTIVAMLYTPDQSTLNQIYVTT